MSVTVVIPSYNHRPYVLQAIESVLAQELTDLDLIVIDDGSQDGSAELIRELWEKRGGFRFIARENRGLLRTLNEGLHLARGEFFCELASDDYFPPGSLQRRIDYLRDSDCVAVFADGVIVQGTSPTAERFLPRQRRQMLAADDPIPAMLNGHLPVFSTGMIRTEVLRRVGGFDEENFRFYEDLDTPIRLALAGRFGFVDVPVICRREHESNVSTSTPHIRVEKVFWYAKLLQMREMAPYGAILRKQLRRSLLKLGRSLRQRKLPAQSREFRALRLGWQFAWQDWRVLYYLLCLRIPK